MEPIRNCQGVQPMPEVKRPVQAIEVNYVCDQCDHGMLEQTGEPDPKTGETVHRCMICGHRQSFRWQHYPRIEYVGLDELP